MRDVRHGVTGAVIDRGLVVWRPGPHSFTGEDLFELHVHGGNAVVGAVFDSLAQQKCRAAVAGEFTRRAFDSGKLDLTQVEGLADLLAAQTEMQLRQAVEQSRGALFRHAEVWLSSIVALRAELEARLDFSDEDDVGPEVPTAFWEELRRLRRDLQEALLTSRAAEQVRHGFKVVLAGAPNAGKSSLFNALARREAAIVTDEPGTTRDVLEVSLDLGGLPIRLCDTAGIREAQSEAERLGIVRAQQAAAEADLVIWLRDPEGGEPGPKTRGTISAVSKADRLGPGREPGRRYLSVITGEGLDSLLAEIRAAAANSIGPEPAVLTRQRHKECIQRALEALRACEDARDEIAADLLRQASDAIGQITGRIGIEEVLDRLFAEFCIGK